MSRFFLLIFWKYWTHEYLRTPTWCPKAWPLTYWTWAFRSVHRLKCVLGLFIIRDIFENIQSAYKYRFSEILSTFLWSISIQSCISWLEDFLSCFLFRMNNCRFHPMWYANINTCSDFLNIHLISWHGYWYNERHDQKMDDMHKRKVYISHLKGLTNRSGWIRSHFPMIKVQRCWLEATQKFWRHFLASDFGAKHDIYFGAQFAYK